VGAGAAPRTTSRHARSAARRDLSLWDFTLLVGGAVIGADISVAAAIGASLPGPTQLVAWLAAGYRRSHAGARTSRLASEPSVQIRR